MVRFILSVVLAGVFFTGQAQNKPLKFGEIDIENLKMEYYPLDSSAGAVVLADFGSTTLDHNVEILFTRHVRIKIFNKSEFDRADIKIPHAKGDMVTRLRAATYNLENGKIVQTEVEKSDMFSENVDKDTKNKTFTMPNVKEGSIIEYTFQVNYGSIKYIMPWYFQKDIPVMYSEYLVELPEFCSYRKIMTGYVQLDDIQSELKNIRILGEAVRSNSQRYIARNVPAFKEEEYLACPDDFISKISFELDVMSLPGQAPRYYMAKSYEHLSYELADDEIYSKELDKGKYASEKVEELTASLSSKEEKAKAIYEWVQENFIVDNDFYEENYKRIYDERRGFAYDINYILIVMLREAGFQAEPVLISTRAHGKPHPYYPSLRNFNYLICAVTDGSKLYLLDASDKRLPFNVLGTKCLNEKGLVISRDNPRWVKLEPGMRSLTMRTMKMELDQEGNVQGNLQVSRTGYDALNFKNSHDEEIDEYKKNFAENLTAWSINGHNIEGLEEKDGALNEEVEMEIVQYAEAMGDMIYVNPIVYGGIKENPFKEETRLFPVDFATPKKEVTNFTIIIPEGYVMEEAPTPVAIALPDNAGKFVYNVSSMNGSLQITSQLMINKTEFLPEEYPLLRQFYAQIVAKQSEQIVLKKSL